MGCEEARNRNSPKNLLKAVRQANGKIIRNLLPYSSYYLHLFQNLIKARLSTKALIKSNLTNSYSIKLKSYSTSVEAKGENTKCPKQKNPPEFSTHSFRDFRQM